MTPQVPGQAACDPHEAAERAWEATGDWEMAVEAALAAQRMRAGAQEPRSGYVTANARDIAIALTGYAGFTGDPVSFASELHERLRRTVFAPELAAAADVRPREGEPGWLDVTCGSCGAESGTNFLIEEIECGECEARRCPHCGGWFGGEEDDE